MEIQLHNFPLELSGTKENWEQLTATILQAVQLKVKSLDVIFVDDATLQKMHLEFLNDPEKTDVMTFNLGDGSAVEGEIYISIDRAKDQAAEYHVTLDEEVLRLVIHGILHLKGFDDQTPEERKEMKKHEEHWLQQFKMHLKT